MTYRDRREVRAENLREWASRRVERAAADEASEPSYVHDWAWITQPGLDRSKENRRTERRFESLAKAESMESRAKSIESQLRHAIYSDDPDAIERLEAKIAKLEAQRAQIKAENAAFRKANGPALRAMSGWDRDNAMPHRAYVTQNLTGNITRERKRLEGLKRDQERPQAQIKNGRKGWYVKCPACQLPYMEGLTFDGAKQLADAHNVEHHLFPATLTASGVGAGLLGY